jgi:hypothetical protein
MNTPKPLHQRLISIIVVAGGVLLFAAVSLDTISRVNTLIPESITYIGTFALVLGCAIAHFALRTFPLTWVVNGQPTRITGLGTKPFAVILGLIALLWLPRAVERLRAPDPATIDWVELLWSGKRLTVDIGDLPEHARGSLLVEGRSYIVWYQQEPCLWQSYGPAQLPKWMEGVVVEQHYNKAGPSIKLDRHLNETESATSIGDCNSPRDRKMVVLSLPVQFDCRGYISFGGSQHRIGALRVPDHWVWPWSRSN